MFFGAFRLLADVKLLVGFYAADMNRSCQLESRKAEGREVVWKLHRWTFGYQVKG